MSEPVVVQPGPDEAAEPTTPDASRPAVESADKPIHPDLPQVRTQAELLKHDGQRVELHGEYEVTPIRFPTHRALPKGVGTQPVFAIFPLGERVMLAFYPSMEQLYLHGHRVVVVGTVHVSNDPRGEGIRLVAGPSLVPESISLHPSVTDAPDPNDWDFTPPKVETRDQANRRLNHWAQIFGTVARMVPLPRTHKDWKVRGEVWVELPDGATLLLHSVENSLWAPHLGKPVSFIGRIDRFGGNPLPVEHVVQVCPGRVERCGMGP